MRSYGNIQKVMLLIDWNSQLHLCPEVDPKNEGRRIQSTWDTISKKLSRIFSKEKTKKFNVSFRIYHGWRKGFEEQPSYKEMKKLLSSVDFYKNMSSSSNVVFREGEHFGDKLLAAETERLCGGDYHLPDTLRDRGREYGRDGKKCVMEKMVDTALASDCVFLAFEEPDIWLIIMGEDDDLIPPAYTAEYIQKRKGAGGRVSLVRRPRRYRGNLKDLLIEEKNRE